MTTTNHTHPSASLQHASEDIHVCPDCGNEAKIIMYAGYGDRGLFWVCEKACGYKQRTR